MGSGKTTVGRHLARIMGFRFIDLDRRIEAIAGRSVARIFELEGEAGFRARESGALAEAGQEEGVVVATGGGATVAPSNRALMATRGTTVWLSPAFETIVRRILAEPQPERPLFVDPDQARALYESRLAGYRQADLEIEIRPDEEAGAVAERVAVLLRGERCAT